jgi:hypothetical protein
MDTKRMLREYQELPPEAQQEVVDFIAFLRDRRDRSARGIEEPIRKEAFIGMWKGRKDMADSTEWVRRARLRQWR